MSKTPGVVLALLLWAGYAGTACAGPFAGTADSGQDYSDGQPSLFGAQFAKASRAKKHMDSEDSATVFEDSKTFVQVYGGYDFSFLDDLVNGSNAWVSYFKSVAPTASLSGGGDHSGIQAGALFGVNLDKSNRLALDLGSVFTFGNNWTASEAGITITQNCSPTLLSASLDYLLTVVNNPGSRTYLTVGAGYYHAVVTDTFNENSPVTTIGGTFTGDTFGGTLGVGEEISLGGSFGLNLSVKGRYASFDKVSSGTATNLDGGTGTSSIAYLQFSPGYNVIIPTSNTYVNTNSSSGMIRYAKVDYSGIDGDIALNLYF